MSRIAEAGAALGSTVVGAVVEGWGELRTHRTRVLLSLIGVALAIAALTSVVALGGIARQSITESQERSSGRPAMLSVYAFDSVAGQNAPDERLREAIDEATAKYGIEHWSSQTWGSLRVQLTTGAYEVSVTAVDRDFADMFRTELERGRWFSARDETRLAPAIVINRTLWAALGSPDLATHPTIELPGDPGTIAEVVGVYPANVEWGSMEAYLLGSDYRRLAPQDQLLGNTPNYFVWVPPELSDPLSERLRASIAQSLGGGYDVQVNRQDYAAWQDSDPLLPLTIMLGGAAGLLLLLGALGLLTISLVTVRYRIQEIGIKRSFGATAGRVFFSVMMESVVATAVAGVVGIALAILALKNPWSTELISQGVSDVPGFPVSAAVLGLVVSIAVGALAGLMPALVAVRIKPIDAIRY